jgi:hypothetical protein
MARNGSGTYSLPAGNPVTTGTVISSTWANSTLNDLGNAMTASLAYDGQTTPVANLPMGGFIHTNVGNATVRTNYASAAQVQDGTLAYLTSVSGTDTITAIAPISMTAYATGQTFRFIAAGANTTTGVTLNINSIGAKNITKNGTTALAIGDIISGSIVEVTYDGTEFQISSQVTSSLLGSNNTWTGTNAFNSALSYTSTLTGGTAIIAIGTNQIYKDTSGKVGLGTASPAAKLAVVGTGYSPNITLTDASTIAWDTSTGQTATFTFVSSNRTMGAPTNLVNGAFYALAVIQNAGSNTLTWDTVFKWTGGSAPTLSTAASAKDYFVFRSDGTNLYEQGRSLGVA